MDGLIPLISSRVYTIAPRCLRSVFNNRSSSYPERLELIMTGYTFFSSKYAYDAEWSTLLVGYPKWKVDADSGKFPLVKIPRFVSSRTQIDTLGGKVNNGAVLNLRFLTSSVPAHNK